MNHVNLSRSPRASRPAPVGERATHELLEELKTIRRSVVPNSGMPIHELAFMQLLDKLLEVRWPHDYDGEPIKPNKVDADEVDAFRASVDAFAVFLTPWFGLRSWFLQRSDVWQTSLDGFDPKSSDDLAAVAAAVVEEVTEPEAERIAIDRLLDEHKRDELERDERKRDKLKRDELKRT